MPGRKFLALALTALLLAGCGLDPNTTGKPFYDIKPRHHDLIQERMLDSINALRSRRGVRQVRTSDTLVKAANRHARDMSAQDRPWNWGSDGSSPIQRAARAGYYGRLLAELVAETYESELETLAAWHAEPDYRARLLDPDARRIGLGWHQEPNGKLWWVLEIGG